MVKILIVLLGYSSFLGSSDAPNPSLLLVPNQVAFHTEAAFPSIPAAVRERLRSVNCQIPQPWPRTRLENVVSGHFISLRRVDLAVLCSKSGVSKVLVINGTNGEVIASLNPVSDSHYMQGQGDNRMEFSRRLEAVVPPESGFCLGLDEPCPCEGSSLDGILDEFEGKASETHCYRKGWHTVTSGD